MNNDYKKSANQIGGEEGPQVSWKAAVGSVFVFFAIFITLGVMGAIEGDAIHPVVCKVA